MKDEIMTILFIAFIVVIATNGYISHQDNQEFIQKIEELKAIKK